MATFLERRNRLYTREINRFKKTMFQFQYYNLSREKKIEFRKLYLERSGMSYSTFNQKLQTDTFLPLEKNLFKEILHEFLPEPFICEEYNEKEITEEQWNEVKEIFNNKSPSK